MKLPSARGPVSAALIDVLSGRSTELPARPVLDDDGDLHLTLFVCYELAYRGWDGVDDSWEWNPGVLRLRAVAEERFMAALRDLAGPPEPVDPATVPQRLRELADADDGPSLSGYLRGRATHEQFREFVAERSVYHLKEADPHTWAIPRLAGAAKAALIEIQIDEYGNGRAPRMHQELFTKTMNWFGLDTTYGGYVDTARAETLANNNLMSLFGLHRRNRGMIIGHLAAYEMTSTAPNRSYGNGLRRLGGDAEATAFYDEHVEADAVHEQIAAHDLAGSFARAEPELAGDVLFGARCALALDTVWAASMLASWQEKSLAGTGG
ncbi:iron-containing redox enzyme family protein [Actinoplanes sp. CA-015351]|uniref:iron-containing redox enzyme family protein n=1 Tax=Actinoplanes sp. CA-015351 TaxID=3239897 RepID=UPI003D97369B